MDETKKRDQSSVIIFYTLVLRRFFFYLSPCAVTLWEFGGDGAIAGPTGAVGLFRFLRIEDCCYL